MGNVFKQVRRPEAKLQTPAHQTGPWLRLKLWLRLRVRVKLHLLSRWLRKQRLQSQRRPGQNHLPEKPRRAEWNLTSQLSNGPAEEVLCTFPKIPLTRKVLSCLLPGGWLNDEVINAYLGVLQQRGRGRIWCPNSFFWSKLRDDGTAAVRRWAARAGVEMASLELILLPLHLNEDHWALGAMNFQSSSLGYFDSLGYDPPSEFITRSQEYLHAIGAAAAEKPRWPLVQEPQPVPLQENDADCGVFLCMFAEHLARGMPASACQAARAAEFRAEIFLTLLSISATQQR